MHKTPVLAWLIAVMSVLFGGSAGAVPSPVRLEITPAGLDERDEAALYRLALDQVSKQSALLGHQFWVVRTHWGDDLDSKDRGGDSNEYIFTVYDYTSRQYWDVQGSLDATRAPRVLPPREGSVPPLDGDEFVRAAEIVRMDPVFRASFERGEWHPYSAMPGVIDDEARARVIAVGLMPDAQGFTHEIVGVDLGAGRVIRYPEGAPPLALATRRRCGPASANQRVTRRGVPGKAVVRTEQGGQTIWKFTVIRPSASAGHWGSGIEIRDAYYRGKKVFSQASVPILNVKYSRNACGPYRDWSYSESYFRATGTSITSGILEADSEPSTIADSGSDRGNFRGVAIYQDGDTTVLTSELEAGWYRYLSEWRFGSDGTIRPRWVFSAVRNSCTCLPHRHHVYWRLDFDLGDSKKNHIFVSDGAGWTQVTRESKQLRDDRHREWLILDDTNSYGYAVIPGDQDGTADAYGKGDVWLLKYAKGQYDDSSVYRNTSANLDAFVSGDTSIEHEDIVFWYGAHMLHDQGNEEPGTEHRVGPTLVPYQWPR